ncbi:hypothetical protein [Microbacterium rhizomatis]|uniref:Fe-S oxidoreductase n=1 Tax=Microbacterium rhizomatis TaxID=1631477 RepID=A0A5J5J2Y6_9MICO|nr:hypothetical protein [Microbacterium rhizomatis]KAA9110426.1 hypothetical protein F6B43_01685 [Microbacterium rhizomatis]
MQLGTRWTAGQTPPAAVPVALRDAIAAVDAVVLTSTDGSPAPRWTLTWLENRARAELDTGVVVRQDADGEVVTEHDADDEFA